jgi:hypothetical protein
MSATSYCDVSRHTVVQALRATRTERSVSEFARGVDVEAARLRSSGTGFHPSTETARRGRDL